MGDRIPQVVEVKDDGADQPVDHWMINGKIRSDWFATVRSDGGGVERGYYPRRWEEVPDIVYDRPRV